MRLPSPAISGSAGSGAVYRFPAHQHQRNAYVCPAQKSSGQQSVASTTVPVKQKEQAQKSEKAVNGNGSQAPPLLRVDGAKDFEVDTVLEKELHDNGRYTRSRAFQECWKVGLIGFRALKLYKPRMSRGTACGLKT